MIETELSCHLEKLPKPFTDDLAHCPFHRKINMDFSGVIQKQRNKDLNNPDL